MVTSARPAEPTFGSTLQFLLLPFALALTPNLSCADGGSDAIGKPPPAIEKMIEAERKTHGIDFYESEIQTKGPATVVSGFHSAPPFTESHVLYGISTGTDRWLSVYEKLRNYSAKSDLSVMRSLDKSLNVALQKRPKTVLSLLGRRAEIAPRDVCGTVMLERTSAGELLNIWKLQETLRGISDASTKSIRDRCLEESNGALARQVSIYRVSSKSKHFQLESEKGIPTDSISRLALIVGKGGADSSGFLRTDLIPEPVLRHCKDSNGKVANPGDEWQSSDVVANENLPNSTLLGVCSLGMHAFDLFCASTERREPNRISHFRLVLRGVEYVDVCDKECAKHTDPWESCLSREK